MKVRRFSLGLSQLLVAFYFKLAHINVLDIIFYNIVWGTKATTIFLPRLIVLIVVLNAIGNTLLLRRSTCLLI
jgi:hypothetical protein